MGTTAVVVHHAGSMSGAMSAIGTIAQCLAGVDHIVVVSDSLTELTSVHGALKRAGVSVDTHYCENLVEAVNRVWRKTKDKNRDALFVYESDVIVQPDGWNKDRLAPLMQFAAVGPAGPDLRWSQRVTPPDAVIARGPMEVAMWQQNSGRDRLASADALDPCCMSISGEALSEERVGLLDSTLSWHWAWMDWFARLYQLGWRRAMVRPSVFAAVPNRPPVLMAADIDGRLAYYAKHAEFTSNTRVCGLLVVEPSTVMQFGLMLTTLDRSVLDGFVLVLMGDLADFAGVSDQDLAALAGRENLHIIEGSDGGSSTGAEAQGASAARDLGYGWAVRLVEGEVCPKLSERSLAHPDPLVYTYNLGRRTLWGSQSTVRTDKPFGDGGDLSDMAKHANDRRLFRVGTPMAHRHGSDGCRAHIVTIDNHYFLWDTQHATGQFQGEAVVDRKPVHFHQLAYEGTKLDDIGRWLDWTQGIADAVVIVWTGQEDIPAELELLVGIHGGQIVRRTTDAPDFSAWRNAALEIAPPGTRAMFFDPDEWLDDPLELMCVRRLLDRPLTGAWTVAARNWRPDGWMETFSLRLFDVDDEVRFRGLVHESVSWALAPRGEIGAAPLKIWNRGNYGAPDKTAGYRTIIRRQLKLDPSSSQHWVSLGWGYANAGHADEALQCFDQAVEHSSETAHLGYLERGTLHLRQSMSDLVEAANRLPKENPKRARIMRWLGVLGRDLSTIPEAVTDPEPMPEVSHAKTRSGPEVIESGDPGHPGEG